MLIRNLHLCKRLQLRQLSTYNFDTLFDTNHIDLPRLPIPDLEDTLQRYEQSIKPLCFSEDELTHTRTMINNFRTSGGLDLQHQLIANDQAQASSGTFPHFYFEDLWDDAYLAARCPNPVNINPTFFMPTEVKPGTQTARAAEMLSTAARWLIHAKNGQLANDGLDMSRLGRIMGTARLPGKDVDSLEYYASTSRHVVVQTKGGLFHRVNILTEDGTQALSISTIETALNQVVHDSKAKTTNEQKHIPGVGILTSLERPAWFEARQELISSDNAARTNAKSLQTIDSALLMVALDDLDTSDVTTYCQSGLHGVDQQTRSDRWWDKMQLIVDPSGRVGWQFEHSFSDGLSWNRWLGEMWHGMGRMETPSNWIYGHLPLASDEKTTTNPTELKWEINDSMTETMKQADDTLRIEMGEGLDTVATLFDGFGKAEMKSMGYSPDAFVQMSYQLAYANLHDGQAAATYEACSTAKHFHGRTETIRSCSEEARSFVQGFRTNTLGNEEKKQLLMAAAQKQSTLSKQAAGGMGVDRHLMALGALARKKGDAATLGMFDDPLYG